MPATITPSTLPKQCRDCKYVKQALAAELDRLKHLLTEVRTAQPASEYFETEQPQEHTAAIV